MAVMAGRRVARLRLALARGDQLGPARHLVEEALRCASLPGAPPGALVVVRRLDLGRFDLDFPPALLASRVAERVRALAVQARCVDGGGGGEAPMVWFSEPSQPPALALRLRAGGRPLAQWYWPLVVGEPLPGADEAGVARLFSLLRRGPEGLVAQARVADELVAAGHGPWLLARFSPALGMEIARAAAVVPMVAVGGGTPARPAPPLPERWLHLLRRAASTWGVGDSRLPALAVLALVAARPVLGEAPRRLGTLAAAWLPHWIIALSTVGGSRPGPGAVGQGDFPSLASLSPAGIQRSVSASPESPDGGSALRSGPATSSPVAAASEFSGSSASTSCEASAPFAFSPLAGLALAVALLERMGMGAWLEQEGALARCDFVPLLLAALGWRFGLPEEDPHRALLEEPAPEDAFDDPLSLPAGWLDRPGPWQRGSRDPARLAAWVQLAMGRWLRRHCGMSLRTLVRRPGRVFVGRLHWEVAFDLDATDLRLRRVALDSDPGWVGWLGRMVRLHYLAPGEVPPGEGA